MNSRNRRARRGSALHEVSALLGVCAILTVLGVSEYRSARIGTSLARAQSDLRAMRHAIEGYTADNLRYPDHTWGTTVYPGWFDVDSFPAQTASITLTTPVAYLKELPRDPFGEVSVRGVHPLYRYVSLQTQRHIFEIGNPPIPGPPCFCLPPNLAAMSRFEFAFGDYFLFSAGPSGFTQADLNPRMIHYDPTNGTFSRGQLLLGQRAESYPYFIFP